MNKYTGHREWCMCDRCFGKFTLTTGPEEIQVIIDALKEDEGNVDTRPLISNLIIKLEDLITPDS